MNNLTNDLLQPIPTAPDVVELTQEALLKVYDLVKEEGNFNLKLRVFVEGGGCSGLKYGFVFDEIQNEDDFLLTKKVKEKDISFLIDSMSAMYLTGAKIDYKDDLQGAQFIIQNPNATTKCGCGSSFA